MKVMQPSAFNNTTTLLSFEKDLNDGQAGTFAATGEFKACQNRPSESGHSAVFFGGKVDEQELCIIDGDHQASFFCNDKSGFSMVEAMQGSKQQKLDSSKEWILNSALLDSKSPAA